MEYAISRLSGVRRAAVAVGVACVAMVLGRPSRGQDAVPIDEHTALMVGAHNLKLGVLAFEYGPTRSLSFGVDAPYWVAGALSPLFAPNLHLKFAVIDRPDLVVSGLVAGYYIRLRDEGTTGQLVTVPLSVFGSVPVARRLWLHGELNYNWVRSVGDGAVNNHEVEGAVATRTGQVGLMGEYRFTRVVAAIARGRYQVYTHRIVVEGTSQIDPYTQAELAAELRPAHPHPWLAVAGMAFTWKHVGLLLAAGYGHVFIPGANIAVKDRGFVPDASFWVTF
jgi:hypothetical protein